MVFSPGKSKALFEKVERGVVDFVIGQSNKFQSTSIGFNKQGRLRFGDFRGNSIGMFDPKTERCQEWEMPTPCSCPSDAFLDEIRYLRFFGVPTPGALGSF
jgi:streptogramin lyase